MCQTPASKVIIADAVHSGARVFQAHENVSRHDMDRTTPRDGNTSIISHRMNSQVLIGGGTTNSPTRTGIQDIGSRKRSTVFVEVRNAQTFNTSNNGNSTNNGDPTSTFSKVIRLELSYNSLADIYLGYWVNFTRITVETKIPNFMNLELLYIHTSDELGSFKIPTTRVGRTTDGSN